MQEQGAIEIHTAEGSFLVWRANDWFHCEAKYPDGKTQQFRFWNEIPPAVKLDIEKAVHDLTPPRMYYPNNPRGSSNFRIINPDSCSNCPQLAS